MRGLFIEDMEEIQEEFERRFVKYAIEYENGNDKAKQKMYNYQNCVEKMKKVMRFINDL